MVHMVRISAVVREGREYGFSVVYDTMERGWSYCEHWTYRRHIPHSISVAGG
jgi:hypothetical protein